MCNSDGVARLKPINGRLLQCAHGVQKRRAICAIILSMFHDKYSRIKVARTFLVVIWSVLLELTAPVDDAEMVYKHQPLSIDSTFSGHNSIPNIPWPDNWALFGSETHSSAVVVWTSYFLSYRLRVLPNGDLKPENQPYYVTQDRLWLAEGRKEMLEKLGYGL